MRRGAADATMTAAAIRRHHAVSRPDRICDKA
jgi:hypothetical protein